MRTACKYSCLMSCVVVVLSAGAWAEEGSTFSVKLGGYLPNTYSTCSFNTGFGTHDPCTSHDDCVVPDEYCRHNFRGIDCSTDDMPDDTKCPGPSECVETVLVAGTPPYMGYRCSAIDTTVPIGMVQSGGTAIVEIYVSSWDSTPNSGICTDDYVPCTVDDPDCPNRHCAADANVSCFNDLNCTTTTPPSHCIDDECSTYPLLGQFQWKMDSTKYYNDHGPLSELTWTETACTGIGPNVDCAHGYTSNNDCTCAPGNCLTDQTCDNDSKTYIERIRGDYLHKNIENQVACIFTTNDFACAAMSYPDVGREDDGAPWYVGTAMLDISEDACGFFELELVPRGLPPYVDEYGTYAADSKGHILARLTLVSLKLWVGVEPSCYPPCNDYNQCTVDHCICGSSCEFIPKECDPGECCCPDTGKCSAACCDVPCPEGMAFDSDQMDIDAGQPKAIDGGVRQGYETFYATGATEADEACWTVSETDAGGCGNSVLDVVESPAGTYAITLAQPLQPGADTEITYTPDTGAPVVGIFTALPGDVDGNRATNVDDLLALIECLTVGTCEIWECDIDRLEDCTGADLERLVDLLNGAGAYESWDGAAPATDPC